MKSFKYTSYESFSTLDGPGIRSVLFLASCPYRCIYCHNPETFCPSEHRLMTFAELSELYDRNRSYYGSQGGLTFSGGEPLAQRKAILEFARLGEPKNLALETSGWALDSAVAELLPLLQFIYVDLKWSTEEDYARYSGGSLKQTLEFMRAVKNAGVAAVVRHVVVPGYNDSDDDLKAVVKLAEQTGLNTLQLLPYHDMGAEKYHRLGLKYALDGVRSLDASQLDRLRSEVSSEFPQMKII